MTEERRIEQERENRQKPANPPTGALLYLMITVINFEFADARTERPARFGACHLCRRLRPTVTHWRGG